MYIFLVFPCKNSPSGCVARIAEIVIAERNLLLSSIFFVQRRYNVGPLETCLHYTLEELGRISQFLLLFSSIQFFVFKMGSYPEELKAMRSNPKFIFFTDFDGTITLEDSEYIFFYSYGRCMRLSQGWGQYLKGFFSEWPPLKKPISYLWLWKSRTTLLSYCLWKDFEF